MSEVQEEDKKSLVKPKSVNVFTTFLTGSRVYGTPTPESDMDMVMFIDYFNLNLLINSGICDKVNIFPHDGSVGIKIGKLNLICLTKQESYKIWLDRTNILLNKAPVTREDAIAELEAGGVPRLIGLSGEE
jgi:hypothetical protein